MSKNTERQFESIPYWQIFMEEWGRVKSEAAAIGLLYEGVSIKRLWPEDPNSVLATSAHEARCLVQKVDFYLDVARRTDEVGNVAQQRLVSGLLPDVMCLSWDNSEDDALNVVKAHHRIVEFLANPKQPEALLEAPYPRFISTFLWNAFHRWRGTNARKIDDSDRNQGSADWPLAPLAKALILWGVADAFAFQNIDPGIREQEMAPEAQARAMLPFLNTFLANSGSGPSEQLVADCAAAMLRELKPIADISDRDQVRKKMQRTCLAWVWCKFTILAKRQEKRRNRKKR